MKFCVAGLVAVTILGTAAKADMSIQWQNTGTGITHDGTATTPITPALGDSALFQLFAVGLDGIAAPGGWDTGDDLLLDTYVHVNNDNSTGDKFGFFQANYGGEGTPFFSDGRVYIRVWGNEDPHFFSGYYTTPVVTVNDLNFRGPGYPPPDVVAPFPPGLIQLFVPVIPEPTCLAMVVAGGIATAVLRLRRNSLADFGLR